MKALKKALKKYLGEIDLKANRKEIKKKREIIKGRTLFLLIATLIALFSVAIVRVVWIKTVNGNEYESSSIANQINKIQDQIISPNRGAILDRNKQSLAVSSTVYNIIVDVRILAQQKKAVQDATISGLVELLGIDENEVRSLIEIDSKTGKPKKDTNWYPIRKKVSFELGKKIKDRNLKCVYAEEDTKRSYPHDSLAAQVIGFLRGDTVWGLESQYNSDLVGTAGRIFRTYEADNSIVTREVAPEEGKTIITTIDQTIQQFAENACKSAYESCLPDHEPINTSAIVMDPNTGEILAMAEYPSYNLNEPTSINLMENALYKEKWEALSEEEKMNKTNSVWKNFNITDTFEPGSIFKPIVIAAAYEEGVLTSKDTFYCGGSKSFNGETIHCHNHSGHGNQTAEQVLANSCNVGMMDIVSKIGREKFYKYQRDFGFGERTGIDLPNEASASSLLYPVDSLNTVELATSSFGQGFNCTAIQAINAFATTINGGNLMRPYLVSQIIDENGSSVKEFSPKVVRKVISEDTSNYLRKSMESVISATGTGKKAKIDGYAIGGKTGTAQQGNRDDNIYTLDFITYFPVENPEYICMLVIHHPEGYSDGVVSPVPIMKDLMQDIINYKSIPPSNSDVSTDDEGVDESEVVIKDYTNKSLKETIKELNGLGVEFDLVGSGGNIVTKQRPEAGSKVKKGSSILLFIGTNDSSPELSAIPNVVGLTVDEAVEYLTSAGFEYSIFEEAGNDQEEAKQKENAEEEDNSDKKEENSSSNKKVYQQVPVSGSNVEKGTIVKIKIN